MPPEDRPKSIPLYGPIDGRTNVSKEPIPYDQLPEELKQYLRDRKVSQGGGEKTSLELLEGKHVLELILYVDRMSPILKTDVYMHLTRSSSMQQRIDDLERLGIITIYYTARNNAQVIVITDKGRRIASLIRDIVAIL